MPGIGEWTEEQLRRFIVDTYEGQRGLPRSSFSEELSGRKLKLSQEVELEPPAKKSMWEQAGHHRLLAASGDIVLSNSVTETNLHDTVTIPKSTLTSVTQTYYGIARMFVSGTILNNTGVGTPTFRLRTYYGTGLLTDDNSIAVPTSAVTRSFEIVSTVFAISPTQVRGHTRFLISAPSAAGTGTGDYGAAALQDSTLISGDVTVDMHSDQVFRTTFTMSTANASLNFNVRFAYTELLNRRF